MTSAEREAHKWLESGGVRATRQRVALARLLVGDGRHRHVSAESLHEAANEAGERVSVATVYNALRLFAGTGLLREIRTDADRLYFDTRTDNHAHFYWEADGRLEDVTEPVGAVESLPPPPPGAEIVGVDVVIRLAPKAVATA